MKQKSWPILQENFEYICSNCGKAKLEYNSHLNLYCPKCGFEINSSFT